MEVEFNVSETLGVVDLPEGTHTKEAHDRRNLLHDLLRTSIAATMTPPFSDCIPVTLAVQRNSIIYNQ